MVQCPNRQMIVKTRGIKPAPRRSRSVAWIIALSTSGAVLAMVSHREADAAKRKACHWDGMWGEWVWLVHDKQYVHEWDSTPLVERYPRSAAAVLCPKACNGQPLTFVWSIR